MLKKLLTLTLIFSSIASLNVHGMKKTYKRHMTPKKQSKKMRCFYIYFEKTEPKNPPFSLIEPCYCIKNNTKEFQILAIFTQKDILRKFYKGDNLFYENLLHIEFELEGSEISNINIEDVETNLGEMKQTIKRVKQLMKN